MQKWPIVLGIALSIPSLILGLTFLTAHLVDAGVVGPKVGWGIYFLVLAQSLYMMCYYAFKAKDKP